MGMASISDGGGGPGGHAVGRSWLLRKSSDDAVELLGGLQVRGVAGAGELCTTAPGILSANGRQESVASSCSP